MVVKYENGKIYKIITNDLNEPCYVGSTTKTYLSQRMTKHVECYRAWVKSTNKNKGKIMSFELFDKYGVQNCKIILLETVKATSKDELRLKEQEYIDKLNCINKIRAIRTAEYEKQYKKNWSIENKDEIKVKKSIYHQANRETIKIKKAIFYQKNKNIISEKRKEYAKHQGRELIKIQRRKTYHCMSCDYSLRLVKRSRHIKTTRHINNTIQYMESITEKYNKVQPIEIQHFTLE